MGQRSHGMLPCRHVLRSVDGLRLDLFQLSHVHRTTLE